MSSPPALAKHSASSGTESPPQDLPIREGRRREGHARRSPNPPFFTENGLKMQHFRHRRALSYHQNERQKASAVISGDFDGALYQYQNAFTQAYSTTKMHHNSSPYIIVAPYSHVFWIKWARGSDCESKGTTACNTSSRATGTPPQVSTPTSMLPGSGSMLPCTWP